MLLRFVSGVMTGRAVGRLAYQAVLTAGGGIAELRLQAWPPGQTWDGPPVQDGTLKMAGDTAVFVGLGHQGGGTVRVEWEAGSAYPEKARVAGGR